MTTAHPRRPPRTLALPRTLPLPRALPRALHTSGRPSSTAQWTTLIRALEFGRPADERIVSDPFASIFLSGVHRRVLTPLAGATPLVRLAERTDPGGVSTSVLCRHAFIDEHLLEALPEVEQIVVLGAGYDSRAYRFARAIGSRPVFEVDLAPLSRRKAAIVAQHLELSSRASITRVEIDFRTESLRSRLTAAGFVPGARTFIAWEGVSMYLTREALLSTLEALALVCGRGSVVAMDFWQHLGGQAIYDRLRRTAVRSMRLIGEPITYEQSADEVASLLAPAGFDVLDLATAPRMTARYASGGRRCDEGMYVVACHLR